MGETHGSAALVLLDEPGASTEPAEGAALAQATMEALLSDGARLVATTHSSALKHWALQPEVPMQLAAMQRSPQSGQPTYRMLPGAVGPSLQPQAQHRGSAWPAAHALVCRVCRGQMGASYALDAAAREGV